MAENRTVEQDLWRRLTLAGLALFAVVCLGVVGFSLLAPESTLLDRFYMTVVTLTTVGYEEVIRTDRPALKVFTMFLMVFGMGFLLFSVTTLTATLVEFDLSHVFRRRRMQKQLAELRNHFIVCGGGETGVHIVEELVATHTPFVVIETEEERCAYLREVDPDMLVLVDDATEEECLAQAGIAHARGLCAALPNDKDNLFLTLTARGMNARLRIVARGVSATVAGKLRRAGADVVVSPNTIGGLRMASELLRPHTVSFLDQMLRDQQADTHRFGELPVAAESAWAGKPLSALPLRDRQMLVVAIRRPDDTFQYVPPADMVVDPGSTLIVLGATHTVAEMRRELTEASA